MIIKKNNLKGNFKRAMATENLKRKCEKVNRKGKSKNDFFMKNKAPYLLNLFGLNNAVDKNFNKTIVPTYFHQKESLKYIFKDHKNIFDNDEVQYTIYIYPSSGIEFKYFSVVIRKILNNLIGEEYSSKCKIINLINYKDESFRIYQIGSMILRTAKMIFNISIMNSSKLYKTSRNNIENCDHIIATNYPSDWFPDNENDINAKKDRYLNEFYSEPVSKFLLNS